MINPQVFCAIGNLLGEDCEENGIQSFDVMFGSESAVTKLRIEAEISRRVAEITTCCPFHKEMFGSEYAVLQQEKGCCNPFRMHDDICLQNGITITEDLYNIYNQRYPFLLPLRVICSLCRQYINEDLFPEPGNKIELKLDFNHSNMNDIYQYAIQRHTNPIYKNLREMQAKSIHALLSDKHLLCVLPTNAGKSAIIFLPGLISAKLMKNKPITIIIYPLINLIQEQYDKLKSYGLECIKMTTDSKYETLKDAYESISDGNPFYVLSNPEALEANGGKKFLINSRQSIKFVMVDECHQIYDWGKAFRPSFGRIGLLRNFLNSKFGLFTGTFSQEMKKMILDSTRLSTSSIQIVAANPDRPEIFLDVRPRTSQWNNDLSFLMEEAETLKTAMLKTVVYFSTTESTYEVNNDFRSNLSYEVIIFPPDLEPTYIAQFEGLDTVNNFLPWDFISDHLSSLSDKETATAVTREFAEKAGYLRLLFTTIFYGMGMDNKTISRVIIYDKDVNSASLWQKIGRCSRGANDRGQAIIYFTKKQKALLFSESCIQKSLLKNLMGYEETGARFNCNCQELECTCIKCNCCTFCKTLAHVDMKLDIL